MQRSRQPQTTKPPAQKKAVLKPLARSRDARRWPSWTLEGDYIDLGDTKSIASAANHAFAKRVNDLYRQYVPDDDREMTEWYWRCHDEIFDLLDAAFLLSIEATTTPAEALVISAALDRHVDCCIERWRTKHLEMAEDWLRCWEYAEGLSNDSPPPAPMKPKPRRDYRRFADIWGAK